MKAVILAGGLGSRLSEETTQRPKPMVEISGFPILWHIMKIYSSHQVNDFIVCLGYKGYYIKEYFANYFLHNSDVTFDLSKNRMDVHQHFGEPWRVTLIDTGGDTMTGGRIKRILPYVKDEEAFCLTYGDGVGNVDIARSIQVHKQHGKLATLTAVQPAGSVYVPLDSWVYPATDRLIVLTGTLQEVLGMRPWTRTQIAGFLERAREMEHDDEGTELQASLEREFEPELNAERERMVVESVYSR